ncbi:MAG TPA: hypothetical protein PLY86_20050, partial [bacterium]|nr:hypothetical protein [bacterium]
QFGCPVHQAVVDIQRGSHFVTSRFVCIITVDLCMDGKIFGEDTVLLYTLPVIPAKIEIQGGRGL